MKSPKTPQVGSFPTPAIPVDRDRSQPCVWRCHRKECLDHPRDSYFEFEDETGDPKCPKCRLDRKYLSFRALIHALIFDPDGPLAGAHGRYRMGCLPKRSFVATKTNQETAVVDYSLVNCIGCIEALNKLKQDGVTLPAPTAVNVEV